MRVEEDIVRADDDTMHRAQRTFVDGDGATRMSGMRRGAESLRVQGQGSPWPGSKLRCRGRGGGGGIAEKRDSGRCECCSELVLKRSISRVYMSAM
jgi:hypothetical protein